MKKVLKSFVLLSLAVVPFLFTSCEDDTNDTTTPKVASQGDIIESGNNYIAVFNVTCPAEGVLKSVTAEYVYNNGKSNGQVSNSNIKISKTSDQFWLVTITFPQMNGDFVVERLDVTAETKGNL